MHKGDGKSGNGDYKGGGGKSCKGDYKGDGKSYGKGHIKGGKGYANVKGDIKGYKGDGKAKGDHTGCKGDGKGDHKGYKDDGKSDAKGGKADYKGGKGYKGEAKGGKADYKGGKGDGHLAKGCEKGDGKMAKGGEKGDGKMAKGGEKGDGEMTKGGWKGGGKMHKGGEKGDGEMPKDGEKGGGEMFKGGKSDGKMAKGGEKGGGKMAQGGEKGDGQMAKGGEKGDGKGGNDDVQPEAAFDLESALEEQLEYDLVLPDDEAAYLTPQAKRKKIMHELTSPADSQGSTAASDFDAVEAGLLAMSAALQKDVAEILKTLGSTIADRSVHARLQNKYPAAPAVDGTPELAPPATPWTPPENAAAAAAAESASADDWQYHNAGADGDLQQYTAAAWEHPAGETQNAQLAASRCSAAAWHDWEHGAGEGTNAKPTAAGAADLQDDADAAYWQHVAASDEWSPKTAWFDDEHWPPRESGSCSGPGVWLHGGDVELWTGGDDWNGFGSDGEDAEQSLALEAAKATTTSTQANDRA